MADTAASTRDPNRRPGDEPDELARRRDVHDRQRQLVVASLLACPPAAANHSEQLGAGRVQVRPVKVTDHDEPQQYLAPTPSVDADHPDVRAFAEQHAVGADDRERAIALYLAVRDGFRYDPYDLDLRPEGFRASRVLERGAGYCVPKAALLAAACRAVGIPARLGFADVRNHITSPRLYEAMGSDVFRYHGYAEVHVEGRWVKATPAFNAELCERVGTAPVEFDGRTDSMLQPLTRGGEQYMEYLRDHGTFADVPINDVVHVWRTEYPTLQSVFRAASQDVSRFEDEATDGA